METVVFKQFNPRNPRRARAIADEQWDLHKAAITKLHNEFLTRARMLDMLRNEYDFHPSMGQLIARLKFWGLNVYAKPSQTINTSDASLHAQTNVATPSTDFETSPSSAQTFGREATARNIAQIHTHNDLSDTMIRQAQPVSPDLSYLNMPDLTDAHGVLIQKHAAELMQNLRCIYSSDTDSDELLCVASFLKVRSHWLNKFPQELSLQFDFEKCYTELAREMSMPQYVRDVLVESRDHLFGADGCNFFRTFAALRTVLTSIHRIVEAVQIHEYLIYCYLATPTHGDPDHGLLFKLLSVDMYRSTLETAGQWMNRSFSSQLGASKCLVNMLYFAQQSGWTDDFSSAGRTSAALQVMLRVRVFLIHAFQEMIKNSTATLSRPEQFMPSLYAEVLGYWRIGQDVISELGRRTWPSSSEALLYENERSINILFGLLSSACSVINVDSAASFQDKIADLQTFVVKDLSDITRACESDFTILQSRKIVPSTTDVFSLKKDLTANELMARLKQLLLSCIVSSSNEGSNTTSSLLSFEGNLRKQLDKVEVLFAGRVFQTLLGYKIRDFNFPALYPIDFRILWRQIDAAVELDADGRLMESLQTYTKLRDNIEDLHLGELEVVMTCRSVFDILMRTLDDRIYALENLTGRQPGAKMFPGFGSEAEAETALGQPMEISEPENLESGQGELTALPMFESMEDSSSLPGNTQDMRDYSRIESKDAQKYTKEWGSGQIHMPTFSIEQEPSNVTLDLRSIRDNSSDILLVAPTLTGDSSTRSSFRSFRNLAARILSAPNRPLSVSSGHLSIETRSSWSFRHVTKYPRSSLVSMQSSE